MITVAFWVVAYLAFGCAFASLVEKKATRRPKQPALAAWLGCVVLGLPVLIWVLVEWYWAKARGLDPKEQP